MNERDFHSDLWTARLRDFLHDCVGSAPCEEKDRIREAGLLLHAGPRAGCATLDLVVIDSMLACGAPESAVLAILGPGISFMLSRGGGGSCLATVVFDDGSEEMISEGATIALALLAAYVSLLLARFERAGGETARVRMSPVARLH